MTKQKIIQAKKDPTIEEIKERVSKTSCGIDRDYFAIEDDMCWILFADGEPFLSPQILKAPKKDTPYAEYWPNENDANFIVNAKADIRALLKEIKRLQGEKNKS